MNAQGLPKSVLMALLLSCLIPVSLFSQPSGLQMKLQLMPNGGEWGVYVKPVGVEPSSTLITSHGQVRIIMPLGTSWSNFQNHAGSWVNFGTWLPQEMPEEQVVSWGFENNPQLPIHLQAGEETLLFSFSLNDCPDTLYLIDCAHFPTEDNPDVCPLCFEHPDNPCPENTVNDNCMVTIPNALLIFDLGKGEYYDYEANYDLHAWNCHDCDNDGIPNAFDDISECLPRNEVHLNLQYDFFDEQWVIKAAPFADFQPTEPSTLESGRVTIMASDDFLPGQIHSLSGGDWVLINEFSDGNGVNYFTFQLQPDGGPVPFEYGKVVKLFKVKNASGTCPDFLTIVGNDHPTALQENELNGIGIEDGQMVEFGYGGLYGHNSWVCDLSPNGGSSPDSLTNGGGTGSALFAAGGNSDEMTIAPNPASDYLDIKISTENTDNQSLVRLVNLHGQTLQTHLADGQNTLRLELGHLPVGLYFLSLERDGKVIQREKMIKK